MSKSFDRHNSLMNIYKSTKLLDEDNIILNEFHEFVRDNNKDESNKNDYRIRMARKYYDKLYKEYAIVDLSRYEYNQMGMRWRTEKEVIEGKGQFICASKGCSTMIDLYSYEIPFNYNEQDEEKYELVKVRVCIDCARKLFYNKLKKLKKSYNKRKLDEVDNDNVSYNDSHDISLDSALSHTEIVKLLHKFERNINQAESKDNKEDSDDEFNDLIV